jgi:hypothetical protein
MQNLRNTKLPSAGLVAGVVQAVVYGGGAAYGLYHSLFNVEGGHRAIVYNRITGVKEKVRPRPLARARAASSPYSPVFPRGIASRSSLPARGAVSRVVSGRSVRLDPFVPKPRRRASTIRPRSSILDPRARRSLTSLHSSAPSFLSPFLSDVHRGHAPDGPLA